MGFPKLTIAKPVMKILTNPEVYLGKGVLKICSKFTGEHPYGSVISINLRSKFALRHGCSPNNLLDIFGTAFSKSTSGWILLKIEMLFK